MLAKNIGSIKIINFPSQRNKIKKKNKQNDCSLYQLSYHQNIVRFIYLYVNMRF